MTDSQHEEHERIIRIFQLVAVTALVILLVGAVFYHIVEKLNWVDSFYFTVITLATVGYGDIVPKTDLGKIFTTFYVLIGIGIIATFANLIIKRAMVRHQMKHDSKQERQDHT